MDANFSSFSETLTFSGRNRIGGGRASKGGDGGQMAQLVGASSSYAKVAGPNPSQGTYRIKTNECINKWNKKKRFSSPPPFPSLKNQLKINADDDGAVGREKTHVSVVSWKHTLRESCVEYC